MCMFQFVYSIFYEFTIVCSVLTPTHLDVRAVFFFQLCTHMRMRIKLLMSYSHWHTKEHYMRFFLGTIRSQNTITVSVNLPYLVTHHLLSAIGAQNAITCF
jgi:hypothetical protein